jgi:segregation and condensation protein B
MGENERQVAAPLTTGSPRENSQIESSPLSLSRLRDAFAAMLNPQAADRAVEAGRSANAQRGDRGVMETAVRLSEINPRSVIEAILFVGRPDNGATSAREMAAAMRGVSPTEIDSAVAQLNAMYDSDATPYTIERTSVGYRLVLRGEFERMRDRFYRRTREAKLSPAALEVLSIVAYNQPLTADEINQLRGAPSGAVVSTLVRRLLIRLEPACEPGEPSRYCTTKRFLQLFGLENLAALPRSEELEKA